MDGDEPQRHSNGQYEAQRNREAERRDARELLSHESREMRWRGKAAIGAGVDKIGCDWRGISNE